MESRVRFAMVMALARNAIAVGLLGLLVAACGGGGGGGSAPPPPPANPPAPPAPPATFSVGGTVSGLVAGDSLNLTLGSQTLSLGADGSFSFPDGLAAGSAYDVRLAAGTQRSRCQVFSGRGTLGTQAVTSVRVSCVGRAWGANGAVLAATLSADGQTLYLAGAFNRVGPQTGPFLPVRADTAVALDGATPFTGSVNVAATDGAGGWFLAARQHDRSTLVWRVNAAGVSQPGFPIDVDGHVGALALADGTLHIGGSFTQVGGVRRGNYALVNAATGALLPAPSAVTGTVSDIAVSPDRIYLAGSISAVGSQARRGLAAIDRSSGALLPWSPVLEADLTSVTVDRLLVNGDTLYLSGAFDRVSGQPRQGLTALDAATGTATAWNPALNQDGDRLCAMSLAHGVLYVGGSFQRIGGQARQGVAALDLSTGRVTAWDAQLGLNAPVRVAACAIATTADRVFLGGNFDRAGGAARDGLASVLASNGTATRWAESQPSAVGQVYWLGAAGETIWVGGGFTTYGGVTRPGMAAIDVRSGRALDWAPDVRTSLDDRPGSGRVHQLMSTPGGIVIAGSFTSINGVPRGGIGAVSPSGTGTPLPWPAAPEGYFPSVNALALDGNTLYLGGGFDTVAGQPRLGLAAVDASNFSLRPWVAAISGLPTRLQAVRGMLLVEGNYVLAPGEAGMRGFVAFDLTSGKRLAWDPDLRPESYQAWAASDSQLYLVNRFVSLSGAPYPEATAVLPQPSLVSPWPAPAALNDGAVFLSQGRLFVSAAQQSQQNGAVTFEFRQRDPITLSPVGDGDAPLWVFDAHPSAVLGSAAAQVVIGRFTRASGEPAGGVLVLPR